MYGRRLYLPEINSRNRPLQQYAERSAINAPMQGTAADIIKRAMIDVDAWCQQPDVHARLLMQVHDELVLEVRADFLDAATARVRELDGRRRHAACAAEGRCRARQQLGPGTLTDGTLATASGEKASPPTDSRWRAARSPLR